MDVTTHRAPTSSRSVEVLCIEDNPSDALLVEAELDEDDAEPMHVTFALRLSEGLNRVRGQPFDVALLDLDLPDSRGIASFERLHAEAPDLPVIVLTGYDDVDTAQLALRHGAQDYLPKARADGWSLRHSIRHAVERQALAVALRRQMDRLEQSEASVRGILDAHGDGVVLVDDQGTVRFTNAAAEAVLGQASSELVGRPWALALPGGPRVECDLERSDGRALALEVTNSRSIWLGQPVRMIVLRDVTAHRELSRTLEQSRRMEAIGRIAGGVSHDFNNLLTVINGCTELLMRDLHHEPTARELLAEIARAGERAFTLTSKLLSVGRGMAVAPERIDLNQVVRSFEPLLVRLIAAPVRIRLELAEGPVPAVVDPSHLEQVILNLAVNARDAMPEGGELLLATSACEVHPASATPELPAGRYARLTVADQGTGIGADVLAHMFEPFFTTKPSGKGTGLGLATVYGAVKQAGGQVTVVSEPGQGATFHVDLPSTGEVTAASKSDEPVELRAGGSETVLVVEDEDGVRRFARCALEAVGYRVLTANGSRRALEHLAAATDSVDLLVSDAIMPGMGGVELVAAARDRRPDLRVLLMSGQDDDTILDSVAGDAPSRFLRKPFTAIGLQRAVRALLDARQR